MGRRDSLLSRSFWTDIRPRTTWPPLNTKRRSRRLLPLYTQVRFLQLRRDSSQEMCHEGGVETVSETGSSSSVATACLVRWTPLYMSFYSPWSFIQRSRSRSDQYSPPSPQTKAFVCQAQEELDKVVGADRLPDFSDREKLPYIEAVYLETRRWQPGVRELRTN